jgi:hypothetical protein
VVPHDRPAWFTVYVRPATVIVPVRAKLLALALTL